MHQKVQATLKGVYRACGPEKKYNHPTTLQRILRGSLLSLHHISSQLLATKPTPVKCGGITSDDAILKLWEAQRQTPSSLPGLPSSTPFSLNQTSTWRWRGYTLQGCTRSEWQGTCDEENQQQGILKNLLTPYNTSGKPVNLCGRPANVALRKSY